jgi:Enoyl-(Acyl carrier protein) reductase
MAVLISKLRIQCSVQVRTSLPVTAGLSHKYFSESTGEEIVFGTQVVRDSRLRVVVAAVITETDLFREMTQEHVAAMKAKIPMGRFLLIDEIAAMVAWIASPEYSFTTGATFDLSGGRATY